MVLCNNWTVHTQRSYLEVAQCLHAEFFWSVFPPICTKYGDSQSKSPYSVQIWENTDQRNSKELFLSSDWLYLAIIVDLASVPLKIEQSDFKYWQFSKISFEEDLVVLRMLQFFGKTNILQCLRETEFQ